MLCLYIVSKEQTTKVSQYPECTAGHFTTFLHASMAAAPKEKEKRESPPLSPRGAAKGLGKGGWDEKE